MSAVGGSQLSLIERASRVLVRGVVRVRWLRRLALSPVVCRPGYWLASGLALAWGFILGFGHTRREGGLIVCSRMPAWGFGRGGTTIGAVYLTRDITSPRVLAHEAVHRRQWKHYGLSFIPLYVAAGRDALHNRFEIEAGLSDGGYI
jgi:hypothetical protein